MFGKINYNVNEFVLVALRCMIDLFPKARSTS